MSVAILKADGPYCDHCDANNKMIRTVTRTLKEENERMKSFVRIGQSYAVNPHYVSEVEENGGVMCVVMAYTGVKLLVSRRYKKRVKEQLSR